MLHDQDISMHLWVEAARKMVYVQNHTPHRVLDNKTLKEDFSGEKPEFSHIRIFSYSVYIHIQKEKRTKLDPSRRKGIFVGYSDTSNSCQIYFQGLKKIDINRDVTFYEDSTNFRSRRKPTQEIKEPKKRESKI